ncbi:MAG: antibiotic biosynthesis monooxygenase [Proteobacteria bacterium]|nr:antibiotic biosynthesis monooxygenase [Pseudomonadota bacterium]
MIIVTGFVHVEPSDLSAFVADSQALARRSRQRDGNLSYAIAVDDRLAGRLLVVERWKDQPALTAHLETPDVQAFVARWQTRMRGDIVKYDAANERALMEA